MEKIKRTALFFLLINLGPGLLWAGTDPVPRMAADLAKKLVQYPDKKIAVLSIPYHDNHRSDVSESISEKLTLALAADKRLSILDRHHILQLLSEYHLSETGLVDQQSAKMIGRALGADILITGTLIELDQEGLEINLRGFMAENGRIIAAARTSGSDPLRALAKKLKANLPTKPPLSLAVLDFTYPKGRLSTGSFLVAERLLTYLVQDGTPVIERRLLQKILEEKRLSESGLMKPGVTENIGKILGVDALVVGSLGDQSETSTDVSARVVQIETTKILSVASATIPRRWMDDPRLPRYSQIRTLVPVFIPPQAQDSENRPQNRVMHRLKDLDNKNKRQRYYPAAVPFFTPPVESLTIRGQI